MWTWLLRTDSPRFFPKGGVRHDLVELVTLKDNESCPNAWVVQLVRTSDSKSLCYGFESHLTHQICGYSSIAEQSPLKRNVAGSSPAIRANWRSIERRVSKGIQGNPHTSLDALSWGISSFSRASVWQTEGDGSEARILHH